MLISNLIIHRIDYKVDKDRVRRIVFIEGKGTLISPLMCGNLTVDKTPCVW